MRIFLDANVLFSASKLSSDIARLISYAVQAKHVLVSSDIAVREAQLNIERKRPAWGIGLTALLKQIEQVDTVCFALDVELAEKDVPLLCSAIRSKCDLFVTGDLRDFRALFDREVHGVTIVSLLRLTQLLVASDD